MALMHQRGIGQVLMMQKIRVGPGNWANGSVLSIMEIQDIFPAPVTKQNVVFVFSSVKSDKFLIGWPISDIRMGDTEAFSSSSPDHDELFYFTLSSCRAYVFFYF